MVFIKEIAQQALQTGYLSIADQKQIHLLLQSNYDSEDLDAFIILQRAVVAGDVKQESRSPKITPATTGKETTANIKRAYQIAAEMAFAAALALTMPKTSTDHSSLGA
jgi:hypothetical protein